jgi:hypothetical protein
LSPTVSKQQSRNPLKSGFEAPEDDRKSGHFNFAESGHLNFAFPGWAPVPAGAHAAHASRVGTGCPPYQRRRLFSRGAYSTIVRSQIPPASIY